MHRGVKLGSTQRSSRNRIVVTSENRAFNVTLMCPPRKWQLSLPHYQHAAQVVRGSTTALFRHLCRGSHEKSRGNYVVPNCASDVYQLEEMEGLQMSAVRLLCEGHSLAIHRFDKNKALSSERFSGRARRKSSNNSLVSQIWQRRLFSLRREK